MRYQDWDVLLFPAGEEVTHVPVKEFHTQCYVEVQGNNGTPLLTTFIPALQRNATFQVSIHSWAKTEPMIAQAADGTMVKEIWQAKVVIDGACVAAETFDIDVTWPQIMTNDNQAHQLRFPPFHKTMLSQNTWNAADTLGRIRVELSSGYLDEKCGGRFSKLAGHVIFAFQPAPMDILEHNAIAWPNQRMYQHPSVPPSSYGGMSNGMSHVPMIKHKRPASISNIHVPVAMGGLATQPLTAHYPYPNMQDTNGIYDPGSRSTSAYSTLTDSAAPLIKKDSFIPHHSNGYPPTYPTAQAEALRQAQNQLNIRLPSDQLDMIIKAIQVPHQTQHIGEPSSTMPPPPLPQHATAPRANDQLQQRHTSFGLTLPTFGENGATTANVSRREASRFSDISMHPTCTSFPACTTEDTDGRIVHRADCNAANNGPSAPASVVRGRKEGSSPTKPRDFFSTILDTTPAMKPRPAHTGTQSPAQRSTEIVTAVAPSLLTSSSPADVTGSKKRTRSALKSLNINDVGSPEKMDLGSAVKPPRKASRASTSSNKENQGNGPDVQDGFMDVV